MEEDVEEMEEIGYEEYFYGEGVSMIEWADLIKEILPERHLRITIEKDLEQGFDYRRISVRRVSSRSQHRLLRGETLNLTPKNA